MRLISLHRMFINIFIQPLEHLIKIAMIFINTKSNSIIGQFGISVVEYQVYIAILI